MAVIHRFREGEALTPARLNEIVQACLGSIVGTDGIEVARSGGKLIIRDVKRDRGIWTGGGGADPDNGLWEEIAIDGVCYASEANAGTNYETQSAVGKIYNNGVDANADQIAYFHLADPASRWLALKEMEIVMDYSRIYCRWSSNSQSHETCTFKVYTIDEDFDVSTLTWNDRPTLGTIGNTLTVDLECTGASTVFNGGAGLLYHGYATSNGTLWYAAGDETATHDPPIYGFAIVCDWSNTGTRAYNEVAQNVSFLETTGFALGQKA